MIIFFENIFLRCFYVVLSNGKKQNNFFRVFRCFVEFNLCSFDHRNIWTLFALFFCFPFHDFSLVQRILKTKTHIYLLVFLIRFLYHSCAKRIQLFVRFVYVWTDVFKENNLENPDFYIILFYM